ncbi:DgyrCDS12738 [Dimorphilus gyrociliatus]|uniref:DgyrCDS12738 n=1 Tax=Dimorphilus gyrociliatus TaxID=2664684 RepID=A0A7I8W7F2_9ANNE|nr:DgyrCDS12738 [Dimorphilus gyrociliatus]
MLLLDYGKYAHLPLKETTVRIRSVKKVRTERKLRSCLETIHANDSRLFANDVAIRQVQTVYYGEHLQPEEIFGGRTKRREISKEAVSLEAGKA